MTQHDDSAPVVANPTRPFSEETGYKPEDGIDPEARIGIGRHGNVLAVALRACAEVLREDPDSRYRIAALLDRFANASEKEDQAPPTLGRRVPPVEGWRTFINDDSTVLVTEWASGRREVATRADRSEVWGPPVRVHGPDER